VDLDGTDFDTDLILTNRSNTGGGQPFDSYFHEPGFGAPGDYDPTGQFNFFGVGFELRR
jgi:hypothetical protein